MKKPLSWVYDAVRLDELDAEQARARAARLRACTTQAACCTPVLCRGRCQP